MATNDSTGSNEVRSPFDVSSELESANSQITAQLDLLQSYAADVGVNDPAGDLVSRVLSVVRTVKKELPILQEAAEILVKHDCPKPPAETVELPAKQYLEFLRMIEHDLPDGVRGYMVTLDGEKRRITPVSDGASVVNLHSLDELFSHFHAGLYGQDYFVKLRDRCNEELARHAARQPAPKFTDSSLRQKITLEAAWEIDQLTSTLIKNIEEDEENLNLVPRGIAIRIRNLAGCQMTANDDATDEQLRIAYGDVTGHYEHEKKAA